MGFEKEGSKSGGGGYVGGFFQLFDWKAKSRKKLFSSKSDLPARSKQGKRSDGTLPMTRFQLMDEDEIVVGSSIRGSDYSCASSVTDDDGCGGRAPGVVARLMGLDSMPTSSFSEPSSTPFFDTQSLRESFHQRKHFEYYHDPQIPYSGKLLNKEDGPSANFLDPKPQKVLSRPIEKFQTEVLPPKSAKTIPITHHKLLSPIKSPGFIPSKTAAHIMEAAARIIEPSPQATARAKISGVGSSSVPLKVRDLKERLEVAQKVPLVVSSSSTTLRNRELREKVDSSNRTSRLAESSRKLVESHAAKYLKGQSLNKSWNGSVDTTSFRALSETEESSSGLKKDKGKSISLAIQAKVNVQRRESLNSSSSRGLVSQKDQNEVMSTQTFKSQPNTQRSLPKKPSAHNPSGVLRQNNHKQNCIMDKDKSPKSSVSNLHSRKAALASASSLSGNSSSVRQKTPGKTVGSKPGARKLVSEVKESDKKLPNHSTNHTPRKKRSIDGNLQVERNLVDNMLIDNNQKEPEPKPAMDRHFNWVEESKRKGIDVVSFTFTAPLMRSMPGYESGSGGHKNNGTCMDNRGKRLLLDTDSTKLSTVGYNMIGGDALSSLLEQKLRELTSSVEASSHNSVKPGLASSSSLSFLQDSSPSFNGSSTSKFHDDKGQNMLLSDKFSSRSNSDVFSNDRGAFRFSHLFQGIDEMEECSSKSNDSRKQIDCRRPSPISILEPSFSTESCSSFDSTDYSSSEGSKQSSSIQALEILGLSSLKKFNYIDGDTDLSDSASSTSTSAATGRSANEWEIEYVQKMFCNLEFMFQNLVIGQSSEIINPNLFNQLEIKKDTGFMNNNSVEARLDRKLLFDCVTECLDIRCRQYVECGYKTWIKGVTMVGRKDFIAQEVLKEISAWRGMGDCMVDELVDKDMSNQYGRWLDFEIDAFSLGAEIEDQIYSSLLDEVVADIFCH